MTMLDADSMHRLAKMALDAGNVSSPDEALELFSRYRLRLHLGTGWAETLAGQACFLTALNAGTRAFLGGVEVYGDLSPALSVPLYAGRHVSSVITELGGIAVSNADTDLPTLVIGETSPPALPSFCVQMGWDHWCCAITPAAVGSPLVCIDDNPLSGIAAAALGVNEAFAHVRSDFPDAGHRSIGLSLWSPLAVKNWHDDAHKGPALTYLPQALWLVGLGHLGQAYTWSLGMLPYPSNARPHLVLQDFDKATKSNLSTCMLLTAADLGKKKVRVIAQRMEAAGFTTSLVERRFGAHHRLMADEPTTALFGVDNVTARRDLDTAEFALVVEAGLGSGYRDFRNIRTHTFPGLRKPTEVWRAEDASQAAVELNETYRRLASERNDLCGMTLLASRAVATPFVGSLAAALVVAEVMRPLHGGHIHDTLDLPMKNVRHRAGSEQTVFHGLPTPHVVVSTRRSG